MGAVHGGKKVFIEPGIRVILIHPDFLSNDIPLLVDAGLCKPRLCQHIEQGLKVLIKAVGAAKIVGRHIIGGESVGTGSGSGESLHSIPFREIKHFML